MTHVLMEFDEQRERGAENETVRGNKPANSLLGH